MADLTITATSVVKSTGAKLVRDKFFGETVTAGMAVYEKSTDGKIYKAQCDGTTEEAALAGVALNGGAVDQPALIQQSGEVTIGATVAVGTVYCVSATAGGICPWADLVTGNKLSIVGYANAAGKLTIYPIASGVAKA